MNEEEPIVADDLTIPDDLFESFQTSTECDHEYLPGFPNKDGLVEISCIHCWHGCAYDPKFMDLYEGKLLPIKRIIE